VAEVNGSGPCSSDQLFTIIPNRYLSLFGTIVAAVDFKCRYMSVFLVLCAYRGNVMKKSTVHSEGDTEPRKQAEEELLLLTAMIEQSSEGIIRTDTEFRINYINDATRALYGWSLDELRGKTPDLFNVDQHADEIQNNIYTMVSSEKPYLGEALNVRKDGSIFYCQFKVSPLKIEKGRKFMAT